MTKSYRITRIRCPECNGTGKGKLIDALPCPCCLGAGKATKERLIGRANTIEWLGDGGYICGDLDYEDMQRYRDEAASLRKRAEVMS